MHSGEGEGKTHAISQSRALSQMQGTLDKDLGQPIGDAKTSLPIGAKVSSIFFLFRQLGLILMISIGLQIGE
jgi:hypothetical protein